MKGNDYVKLELERSEFLKAWQIAEKYTGNKSTMDSLEGVRITAREDNTVTLEATDLKTSVKCTAKGVNVLEPGVAVLKASTFGDMLKKTSAQTFTLETGDSRGLLNAGKSKSRFPVIPPETFPNIPESGGAEDICTLQASDLGRLINEGSAAASAPSDFPKYLGTCLLRTSDNIIMAVSTDGKRLARSKRSCDPVQKKEDLLLPSAATKDLAKIFTGDNNVKIRADGSTVWFCLEDSEFSVRRVEASFPNFERILNNDCKTSLKISRDELIQALDRIDIIAKNTPAHLMAMLLSPDGELRIIARAPEFGTATETLEAHIEGENLQIGFNAAYFSDGLKALGAGDVLIEFSSEEGQTRMLRAEGDDYLYMLMPIRLTPQDLLSDDDPADFSAPNQPEDDQAQAQEESYESGDDSEGAPF